MINQFGRLMVFGILSILILSACSGGKNAEEHLQEGQIHLEDGDVSKAIASLEEALKKEPGLAKGHRLLGEALGRNGRWPEAVKQFEAYQALSEGDAAAQFLLGKAYIQTGDTKKAAVTFAEGVREDPDFLVSHQEEIAAAADDFLKAGREALDTGDLATATELLTMVAPLVPGQGDVYILLGQAHQQSNDIVQALAAYGNAVSLNPELQDAHADEIDATAQQGLEMGQAALEAGDLSMAAQVLGLTAALLPDEPRVHFLLGNAYNQANQFAQAIEQYQIVLSLEPNSSSAHTNMGVVFYKMGDLQKAVEEFNVALEIEPGDAETHYLLGAAYVQMEQFESGQTEFEAALELDDQLAPSYIGLGNVYLLQGDIVSALEMAEQAITLSPNLPEAYFLLGQVHIQLENIVEARNALEQVLSLNPAPHWRDQAERLLQSLEPE
jgi:tetratricopeptide (TPR) repeat protein